MKTKFGPALRWQLREYGLGVFTFWAVMLALEVFFVAVSLIALAHGEGSGESNFNGAGGIAWFCYFVLGLAQVRADLRLGAQFGIPRFTMMKATWAAALLTGACLALALELLTGAGQLMLAGKEGLYVGDLYQTVYLGEAGGVMSLGGHLASAAFNLCGMLAAFGAGAALSLVLWLFGQVRWVVLACLALPVAVSGLIWLAATLGVDPTPFFLWLLASPLNCGGFFLAAAALTGLAGWLALGRVNIRPGVV